MLKLTLKNDKRTTNPSWAEDFRIVIEDMEPQEDSFNDIGMSLGGFYKLVHGELMPPETIKLHYSFGYFVASDGLSTHYLGPSFLELGCDWDKF